MLQYNTASPGHGQQERGTGPAIRPGWRAASAHDKTARATIRQARHAGGRWVGARHGKELTRGMARGTAQGRASRGCDTAAWSL